MRKVLLFFSILLFFYPPNTLAQPTPPSRIQNEINSYQVSKSGYFIEKFESSITVNKDKSLTVEEKIQVNFLKEKHGIFRIIPLVYSSQTKTIKAGFRLLSVSDERGRPYPYKISRLGQSQKIKIGNPNKTISGVHTYVIRYKISDVVLRYPEQDEV